MPSVPVVARAGVTGSPATLLLRHIYAVPIPHQIPHPLVVLSQMRSRASVSAAGVLAVRAAVRLHPPSVQKSNRERTRRHLRASAAPVVGSVTIVDHRAARWSRHMRPSLLRDKMVRRRLHIRLSQPISAAMFTRGRKRLIGIPALMAAQTCMPRSISAPTIADC